MTGSLLLPVLVVCCCILCLQWDSPHMSMQATYAPIKVSSGQVLSDVQTSICLI